jgi:hypothetical protein
MSRRKIKDKERPFSPEAGALGDIKSPESSKSRPPEGGPKAVRGVASPWPPSLKPMGPKIHIKACLASLSLHAIPFKGGCHELF